jgi:hypothetical protein
VWAFLIRLALLTGTDAAHGKRKGISIDENDPIILAKRLEILNWIYPQEIDRRQKEIAQVRAKGSGDWFLRSEIYKTWLNGNSDCKVLFCHGMRTIF